MILMECEPTTFDQQSEAIATTVQGPVMVKGVSVRSTKLHQSTSEFINAGTASHQHNKNDGVAYGDSHLACE